MANLAAALKLQLKRAKRRLKHFNPSRFRYETDVFAVRTVNTGFMSDEGFAAAWRVNETPIFGPVVCRISDGGHMCAAGPRITA